MLVMAKETLKGTFVIIKVQVIKETEKQFKLLNTGRAILNKSDLNKWLAYGEIYCQLEDLQPLLKERIQTRLERVRSQIESLQDTLNGLEYSESTVTDIGVCPKCSLVEVLDALSRDDETAICSTCATHEGIMSIME